MTLPAGHILHQGKVYLRPSRAGVLMGVTGLTVSRWFKDRKIDGILLPAKRGKKNVLYVCKASLTKKLFEHACTNCGKMFHSKRTQTTGEKRFCSKQCCYRWWNVHYPPDSNGVRRKHPAGN